MASGTIVGKVDTVLGSGNILIIRSTGESVVAQPGDLVFCDDTVVAGVSSEVVIETSTDFAADAGFIKIGPVEAAALTSTLADNIASQLAGSTQSSPVDVGQAPSAEQVAAFNALFTSAPLCFLAGALIETTQGEIAVESLQIGAELMCEDGRTARVLWIGRQVLSRVMHGTHMQPVRIRAGALRDGIPHSDLTVTADHGMMLDGYVINAAALVNHDTIDFVPMEDLEDSFTVYHIETENHEVILANGAPTETFVDAITRSHFDNFQDYLYMYGSERIVPEMRRPRISAHRLLPVSIKARLGPVDSADPGTHLESRQWVAGHR